MAKERDWIHLTPYFKIELNGHDRFTDCMIIGSCYRGGKVCIHISSDPDDEKFKDHTIVRCVGDCCKRCVVIPLLVQTAEKLRAAANDAYQRALTMEQLIEHGSQIVGSAYDDVLLA